ncbi:MAG TPA: sigma 54-interacting transcriptional regulator [Chitinophagaceae bacterium]|nr:sigma 54-interacting transcriptional regulator [Chitinophagaceae bacterium]
MGRQNEILIYLINELVRVRDKEDMLQLIRKGLKQYIDFDDSFIMRYDPATKKIRSYIYHVEKGRLEDPGFENQLNIEYTIHEDLLASTNIPVVQDVNSLVASGDNQLLYIHNAGIKEIVSVRLIEGDQLMGLFVLLSEKKNTYTAEKLELLEKISKPVSIATANIIANEEIARKEEEKNLLLSLSNEIASLKTREDLFKVVNTKIKKLIGVEEFGIAQIDEGGETYSAFVLEFSDHTRNLLHFHEVTSARYSTSDPIFQKVMGSDEPVLFEVEELYRLPGMPAYVKFWKEANFKFYYSIPLRVGGVGIGFVNIHFDTREAAYTNRALITGICAQLGVGVSNILAIEKVFKREEEKSMLLDFSNAIASVQDKFVFAKVVKQQLKTLFGIEEYVVNILSEDEKYVIGFLYDIESQMLAKEEFLKILDTPIDVNDGIFNRILASEDPLTFKVEDWEKMETPPVYLEAAKATGLKKMTGLRMRIGEKNIAFFSFKHNELDLPHSQLVFLKSICSQIAIAVSNIMAHEKISRQLAEIEKYKQQLEEEKTYLREEIETTQNYSEIIGQSKEIKKVFKLITQVSSSDSTVLLLGETGTGKELIARAIHNASPRKEKLMVKINCAALPVNLIESELFGHERGSFTGAVERRIGKFELANHGSLFLDEIGEMPLELQVKLLRALQEKEIERIGGKTTIRTDVRIIAATNRDLEKLMEEGKFRSDLYYRLNIFPIHVPPLRDRKEDIPELAMHFIKRFSKKAGREIDKIGSRALEELRNYHWPGNIREMEHLIERSVLLSSGDTIKDIHLPGKRGLQTAKPSTETFKVQTLFENEKEYILKVLKQVNGRIAGDGGAAELLGIPPSTLNSRLKKLGIKRAHQG